MSASVLEHSSTSSSSSSSSSSSHASGHASRRSLHKSVDFLCKKISKKLGVGIHESISCAEHRSAGEYMAELKQRLLDPSETEEISSQSKMTLTCAGVYLLKRIVCGGESDESVQDFKQTLALLFVLIVLSNRPRTAFQVSTGGQEDAADVDMADEEEEEGEEEEEDDGEKKDTRLEEEKAIGTWEAGCFRDEIPECVKDEMAADLRPDHRASTICRLCMQIADKRADTLRFDQVITLACYFFHESSKAMSLQLFNGISKQGDDFLTLSSASFLAAASSTNSTKLAAIADIAESESGQSVLRDFILSFTLPRQVVGLRKTCLLTRQSNNRATKEYPVILGEAHDAAMRGAEYSFAEDQNIIHKMCALLAGIAVILTKNAQSIRRDDAFRGRVSLPFLETKLEKQFEFLPRMQYVSETDDWVVYTISGKTGMPSVEFRGGGYEGCCQACLLFMNSVDT